MKGGEGTVFYDVPYWRFSGCARVNGVGTEMRSRSVRCNILAGDVQCVKVNAARCLSTRSQISRASISKNPRPEAWAMLGTALPYFTNSRSSNIVYLECAIRENNEAVPFSTIWYTPHCSHDH
jgi:hypothetical protein